MLKNLAGLWRHRALAYVLVAREMKARYRGSVLGFFWSLLNPLLMLAVYAVVFAVIFQSRSPATSPYALFLFSGLLPWNWLSSSLTDAASSLTTHGALLRKILFPAEVLPLVAVFAQGLHFVFALPILLAGLILGSLGVFGPRIPLGWPLVQAVPLLVLEGVFVAGIGLLLAALTVHFRDVKDLLATALSLWFFATPIIYSWRQENVQRYKRLFAGPRWEKLRGKGARVQRLLWASTGTKNPDYSDVLYVEELVARDTVNTVPPATMDAFRDHGKVRDSLEENIDRAEHTMAALDRAGISIDAVTAKLVDEGVQLCSATGSTARATR